jgi:hypothetical protein
LESGEKRKGASSSSHLEHDTPGLFGRGKNPREETIERGGRATKCNSGRKCWILVVLALRRISLCKRPEQQGKAETTAAEAASQPYTQRKYASTNTKKKEKKKRIFNAT